MGSGASSRTWPRAFHLTSNVPDHTGESYSQVFPVWTIAITNNQRQLAAATSDHRINLWCLVSHTLLIPLVGHADTIWRVAYSPDDVLLASASADGTVRIWAVANGMPVMVLPRHHANWVWSLAWSPDGTRLATGGSDARIIIWDAAAAAEAAKRAEMTSQNAMEDPSWIEAAQYEAEKAAEASRPLLHWQAHEKSITQLTFAESESRMLVSVGQEGSLAMWDAEAGTLDCRLMGHIGPVTCVSVSPANSELVATGGEDHTVRLWDLKDVEPGSNMAKRSCEKLIGLNLPHFTLKGHEGGITGVKFCGDGKLLASVSKDCCARIWLPNLENPTLLAKFVCHEAWVRDLLWTPDQKFLYSASADGLIFAWTVPAKWHAKITRVGGRGGGKYKT